MRPDLGTSLRAGGLTTIRPTGLALRRSFAPFHLPVERYGFLGPHFSPLPLLQGAVLSLCHYPWPHGRPPCDGYTALQCPDFPLNRKDQATHTVRLRADSTIPTAIDQAD